MIPIDRFLAWQCTNCGEWSVHEIRYAWKVWQDRSTAMYWKKLKLHCHICNHVSQAKHYDSIGLSVNHELFHDARACSLHVREKNFKRSGLSSEDFIKASHR